MTIFTRSRLAIATLAALGLSAAPAHAGGFDGSAVTGSLMFNGSPPNFFDPANGFVPAGFENTAGTTVPISESNVEFGFMDPSNSDTADFGHNSLNITDVGNGSSFGVTYTFSDPAFTGATLLNQNYGALTYSFSGDTLTVNTPQLLGAGTYTANFSIDTGSAPVPEASTTVSFGLLLALGMGGVVVAAQKKKAVSA